MVKRPGLTAVMTALLMMASALAGVGNSRASPVPAQALGKHCALQSGRSPETATPEEVGMDSATLKQASDFAAGRNRLNLQVYRHNCLVGMGPHNAETGKIPWNIWSVTKSITSLVTGIAIDQGKLDPTAPIDKYLPPGIGDKAHRAITVEDLMTETSGLRQAVVAEGITGVLPIDPDSPAQALGLPLDYKPGTTFIYSQRTVDLLVYTVQSAIQEDFQTFAQRNLFDPLGIKASDYYWKRDRSGHTYGYAHLLFPPDDLAKIGLLLANNGKWGNRQVISTDYLHKATLGHKTNPCYGYLIWLTGKDCDEPVDNMPPGSFSTSGMLSQNNFVMPSLDMVISWTGIGGTNSSEGLVGQFEKTAELAHTFMRGVFASLRDTKVPDAGPYREPDEGTLEVGDFIQPDVLLADVGIGPSAYPGCGMFSCLNLALKPPLADGPPGCVIVVCLGPDPRTPGIR